MNPRRPVLVTGGAGYIGSHTCKALAASGYLPIVYDNLSTGDAATVKWGPLIEANVLDANELASTITRFQPVAVIHFAACAYVGESTIDPAKYYRNNVVGIHTLLEACNAAALDKIVFSSSCATYGIPAVVPINEGAPQSPINPYGKTKLICEQMLSDYAVAYGLKFAALRYFNACGADPDGELGESHDPETHLIPLALMAAAGRADALNIFGDDYETPDGTCVRDFIHVSDLAAGHVATLRHLLNSGGSFAVNLGTGKGYSVKGIIEAIGCVTGLTVPTCVAPRRRGDPPVLVADSALARKVLNFDPRYSDIHTIVRTAADYMGLVPRCGARGSGERVSYG